MKFGLFSHSSTLEQVNDHTGFTIGSPAQVIDKVMASRERFGDFQCQLFGLEHGGMPESTVHEMIDLLGSEVLPVLHRELLPAAG